MARAPGHRHSVKHGPTNLTLNGVPRWTVLDSHQCSELWYSGDSLRGLDSEGTGKAGIDCCK